MLDRIGCPGEFQEMVCLGIKMSDIPLFIIDDDAFVYVVQYGRQKGNLILFAPVQKYQVMGVLVGRQDGRFTGRNGKDWQPCVRKKRHDQTADDSRTW